MSARHSLSRHILIAAIACVARVRSDSAAAADKKPAPKPARTIKDLENREVQVSPDPPTRREAAAGDRAIPPFLELQSKNEKMRTEAMRRLGDLQVEVDEAARAAGVDSGVEGLELKEAIALYEGLLKSHPELSAQRRRDVSAVARARSAGASPRRRWPCSISWSRSIRRARGTRKRSSVAAKSCSAPAAIAMPSSLTAPSSRRARTATSTSRACTSTAGRCSSKAAARKASLRSCKVLDRVLVRDGKLRERDSLTRPERELSEDTLRVMAITFSDLDGPETLDALLKQRGDPLYAHQLYEGLGNLYISKERFQDAALAFEAFAKRRPDDRYAPSLQMRTIEAYQKGGFASLVLEGKQAFVERYAFGSAFWQTRTIADAPEVAAQLKTTQKDLAEYYHAKAQKSKKVEDYTAAARWYRAMLDSFPQDAEAPATRYLLGEVLFESGRYAEAAREYERTAYDYPLHAKSAAAGYAALIAYQKHEPTMTGESKALWHRQGIESSLMFATSFPEHAESARVLTKSDEELFALNEFDRVIEVSKQILERNPPVERGYQRTAATLLAHRCSIAAATSKPRPPTCARRVLPANDPDRPAIEERIAASIYKQAEAKQAAGDANGAVDDFLRVGMLAPNAKVRANAEFDAAGILIHNKQWDRASQVLEGFRRNYPNHELAPEVTRKLAVAYLETGRSTQAAGEFERIAARAEEIGGRSSRSVVAGRGAVRKVRIADQRGPRCTRTTCKQYPMPLDPAMDARQKLADMAKAQNDYKARTQWNDDIIRADKSAAPRAPIAASTSLPRRRSRRSSRRSRCSMRSSWSRRSTSRSSRSARRWRRY